jgi:hypothetical protein
MSVSDFAGQPIEGQIRKAFERTAARKSPTGGFPTN